MTEPAPPPYPAPRPATPGVGPSPEITRLAALRRSRAGRFTAGAWRWKGLIAAGVAGAYVWTVWEGEKRKAFKRDTIHDNTYLYWKIYDGGIVEAISAGSSLNYLLSSSQGGSPEEPPRVMTLFDVVRTLKFIEADDRIRGIVADFSSTSVPSVPSYNLGLAQVEEIQDALLELRRVKQEKFGTEEPDGWRTVAWTDSFYSQGQYLLASAFDEIYCQPTGEVPLVGMGSTTPFFGRLAKWLGIEVHAEARNEYKAFVQPYIDEQLTPPQRENHLQLLADLNDNLMTYIGRNRFSSPTKSGRESLEHVKSLSKVGPFTAARALEVGLIDGVCYRQDVLDSVMNEEQEHVRALPLSGVGSVLKPVLDIAGAEAAAPSSPTLELEKEKKWAEEGKKERNLMGFYHFHKVVERAAEKFLKDTIEVGVVYLLGGIGDPGEFGTASVVRGLKEAGEDETIGAVVLRIDSGGGAVVASDTIWAAVRDLRNKGKTVVASFGNSCASGGYWVSTHADAILAAPSTVTGSIGVAALRPTFLQRFFDRFHITLENLSVGSRAMDVTHSLTPEEIERHKQGVDAMYADFKRRVCEGRGIGEQVIEGIAGGRVMTGLRAFELNAPKELIDQIKGFEAQGKAEEAVVIADSTVQAKQQDTTVAELGEGQETSPFAVPEVIASPDAASPSSPSSSDSDATPLASPNTPASSPNADVSSTDPPGEPADSLVPAKPASTGAVNGAAGLYEYEEGPYGRGLIDGLGGLRDAAIYACQVFIANGVTGYKMENPDVSDDEAIKTLLPEAKFVEAEDGQMALQVDVRLKRFPVHKSFWQQLAEASRRGDSMADQLSLSLLPSFQFLKSNFAHYFLSSLADSVLSSASDLDGLSTSGSNGVRGTATPGLGLGTAASWARSGGRGARAEWTSAGGRWV